MYSDAVTTIPHTDGMDDLYKTIGRQVREKREKRELTQGQLAARVGLQRTSLSNIEAGRQKMLVGTLLSIAAELGVQASTLLPKAGVASPGTIMFSVPDDMPEEDARFLLGAQGMRRGMVRKGMTK